MKKILFILFLMAFLTSCGPKRLRCGPGRCSIETTKTNSTVNNIC
ncbi:lipoprotein [Flavobacterium anseongense]